MDKLVIKSFVVSVRNKLIQNFIQKAYQVGVSEKEIKYINRIGISTVSPKLFAKFQTSFYTSSEHAIHKALGGY